MSVVVKNKRAHVRRLSSGKKVKVKAHKQRYNKKSLTPRQQKFVRDTRHKLSKIKKSRTNKQLFIARRKAAQEVFVHRTDDVWKDLSENNAPVGFISDTNRWNNWLKSLGADGDLLNVDTKNVIQGTSIPEPWWLLRKSKEWKRESHLALKNMRKKRPNKNYDKWELETGIKVEMEHTDDPVIAEIIAKDHLDEFPDYYFYLVNMEKILKELKGESRNIKRFLIKLQNRWVRKIVKRKLKRKFKKTIENTTIIINPGKDEVINISLD